MFLRVRVWVRVRVRVRVRVSEQAGIVFLRFFFRS